MNKTSIKSLVVKKKDSINILNQTNITGMKISYLSLEFPLTKVLSQLEFLAASKETRSAYEDMYKIIQILNTEYPFKNSLTSFTSRTVKEDEFNFLFKLKAVKGEYFFKYIEDTLANNALDLKTFDEDSIGPITIDSKKPVKFIMPINVLEFKELSTKLKNAYPQFNLKKIHLTFRFVLKSSTINLESFNNLVVVKNIIPFNPPAY